MRIVKSFVPALFTASLFCGLALGVTPDRVKGDLVSGQTIRLPGNVHHKALPQFDQGPVDASFRLGTMTLLTELTPSQRKDLAQLVAQQQDRKSSNYHKWLTPEQFADRFGLSQRDMLRISAWLKSQGFSSIQTARGRNWISFTGTAAQVQRAFGTEIHHYKVNREVHYANSTAPAIPAAVGGVVTGIRGLHDFRPKALGIRRSSGVRPYYNSSNFGDLIEPGDVATIYDINPLYAAGVDGTGQTLAVIGQTDIYLADINGFRNGFNLAAINCTPNSSGVITTTCNEAHLRYVLGGQDPGVISGDLSEADLDVEWAGAIAKNAQIIYVNSTDVFTSYYYAIDQNLARVISLSYGLCEFGDNFLSQDETELLKANSQGITFVNSSGDSGAAECDPTISTGPDPNGASATEGLAVSYPASSPEVTGVGGTAIALADIPFPPPSTYWGTAEGPNGGTALSYIPEIAWNDNSEIADFCLANSSNLFCTQGGTPAVTGWVPIVDAKTAQTDFAIQSTGISSGGGGVSNCSVQNSTFSACISGFAQPSWQTVTVPSQSAGRFTPDVSLLASANFPGFIFCTPLSELGGSGSTSSCATGISNSVENDGSIIGGTSVSAPVFAGIVALLNQKVGGSGLGNINPTLYSLAATSSNNAFHRVTTGDNLVYCTKNSPSVQPVAMQCPSSGVFGFQASNSDLTTGYNLVTGLGSVDADRLATAWTGATPPDFTLTPTTASFQVAQGSSVDATVTVNLASGFAGPVTFTCTDPAPESTCTAPSSIGTTSNVSFHITTTLPTVAALHSSHANRFVYALFLPGLLGLALTAGSRRRSWRGMRFLGLMIVLGFSTLWLASCGGGNKGSNSNPGTPTGSYTITVNATSGSTSVPASFQLIVQ